MKSFHTNRYRLCAVGGNAWVRQRLYRPKVCGAHLKIGPDGKLYLLSDKSAEPSSIY